MSRWLYFSIILIIHSFNVRAQNFGFWSDLNVNSRQSSYISLTGKLGQQLTIIPEARSNNLYYSGRFRYSPDAILKRREGKKSLMSTSFIFSNYFIYTKNSPVNIEFRATEQIKINARKANGKFKHYALIRLEERFNIQAGQNSFRLRGRIYLCSLYSFIKKNKGWQVGVGLEVLMNFLSDQVFYQERFRIFFLYRFNKRYSVGINNTLVVSRDGDFAFDNEGIDRSINQFVLNLKFYYRIFKASKNEKP